MDTNPTPDVPARSPADEPPDPGDLALIDDMLARSPEERLRALEQTLRDLEALLDATGSPTPAE